MIDHMGIRSANIVAARRFYDAALAPLGASVVHQVPLDRTGGRVVLGYGRAMPQFFVNQGETASEAQHIAFTARTRAEVDAFHHAAMAAGGRDNGGPGLRPEYHRHYYGAFVLDPDDNNIEAVCHQAP